jgi:hypothetical protein
MGIESSLKNYLNTAYNKEAIKNSNNPEYVRERLIKSFKRKVKEGKVILTKGGGYTTSKESQDEADELFGKARSRFGFNPSGKNKGGKIKTYAKGGGVRKPKMTAGY